MALGMLYTCTCGTRFKVYIPKQKLFRPVTGKTVDWTAVDAREEEHGDVAEVKRMADVTSTTFLDMRDMDNVECPACGEEMRLLHYFRSLFALSPSSPAPSRHTADRRLEHSGQKVHA